MKEFLNTLLKSLDLIEIKGKANMDVMLGCMMAIERKIAELEEQERKEEVEEEGGEDG